MVRHVDVLYHEATFTNEHIQEAAISFHSTAEQATNIAMQANVGQLLIGHFSGRYSSTEQLLAEAKNIFENTEIAEAGKCVEVHFKSIKQ